jgi:phosphatidylethanolamine-binding protein (PEBP) family uncharacterized protein
MRRALLAAAVIMLLSAPAQAFEVSFDWGDIPSCTTGIPNTVPSPEFKLSNVPEGAAKLDFHLHDLNVAYDHGGGSVAYMGGGAVPAGTFTYQSPCPPDGPHTYEWTVTVFDAAGKTIGLTKVQRRYP